MRYRADTSPGMDGALLYLACREEGAKRAFLTTDADHKGAANRFYNCGWGLNHQFLAHPSRRMNRYVRNLDLVPSTSLQRMAGL